MNIDLLCLKIGYFVVGLTLGMAIESYMNLRRWKSVNKKIEEISDIIENREVLGEDNAKEV